MQLRAIAVSALLLAAPLAAAQSGKDSYAKDMEYEVRIYDIADMPAGADLRAVVEFMPIKVEKVTPSLIAVAARVEDHEALRAVLGQLRAIAPERVTLSVLLHRIDDLAEVHVGAPAPDSVLEAEVVRRIHAVGSRRSVMSLGSTDSITYIKDLTPIVGTQSAAMDPATDIAHSGLKLEVLVGDRKDGRSSVTVRGAVFDSWIEGRSKVAVESAQALVGPDALDLLSRTERVLHADLTVSEAGPVVAAIVDDPENPSSSLVLTVAVNPAP